MGLSAEQISKLIALVASTTKDAMDCDGCLGHISEFAEVTLAGKTATESMELVETHLVNCPCCADEFQALLDALSGVDDSTES